MAHDDTEPWTKPALKAALAALDATVSSDGELVRGETSLYRDTGSVSPQPFTAMAAYALVRDLQISRRFVRFFQPHYLQEAARYLQSKGVTAAIEPRAGRGFVSAFLDAAGLPCQAFDPRPPDDTVHPVTKSGWQEAAELAPKPLALVLSWCEGADTGSALIRLAEDLPLVTHLLICTDDTGHAEDYILPETSGVFRIDSDAPTHQVWIPFSVHPTWQVLVRA